MKNLRRSAIALALLLVPTFMWGQQVFNLPRVAQVDEVCVEVAEGNAPQLPYQVWATYDNGKSEWRTVRWTNSLALLFIYEQSKKSITL